MASKQKTNQTVRMATPDQLKQVWAIVVQALPTRLTWAQAQYWIGHGRELAAKVRAVFTAVDPYRDVLATWEKLYADHFGMTVDLSGLRVPDPKPGSTRLIVVVPGLTIESVLAVCAKRLRVWRWTNDNLDTITTSDRSAVAGPYAVWVRDVQEADPEHANKSYNDLKEVGVLGITLLERLLLELVYFLETGQHLDVSNITLCSGSLSRDGGVPSVDFGDGRLYVNWCSRGSAHVDLRSRQVVVG
ncbi:MAG: hypothetical protein IT405_01265 [Candidatus Yanofskybacteria bacterium]|nr:hypothetical protein [Candidatus Yanofskybacteria bacterium]